MSHSEPARAGAALPAADAGGTPAVGARHVDGERFVEVFARAQLPTRHGAFTALVCRGEVPGPEHMILVRGAVAGASAVPTRVHSECLTGDVLGSERCDCRDQLEMSLARLGAAERGILLYLRQEGRGIGLGQKIRAYALQETGLDTFEANQRLGFGDDLRDWHVAAMLLALLAPRSVCLLTNNPAKVRGLRAHGTEVAGREPVCARPNRHNQGYLRAKARKGGHLLELP